MKPVQTQNVSQSPTRNGVNLSSQSPDVSPVRTKLKDMQDCGLDEAGESEDDGEGDDTYQPKKYEYIALNPFRDLYK